jgi:hypothetical protein
VRPFCARRRRVKRRPVRKQRLQPRQLDVHGGEVLLKLLTKLGNKTDDFLQDLAVLTALTIERGYATVDQGKPGFRIV